MKLVILSTMVIPEVSEPQLQAVAAIAREAGLAVEILDVRPRWRRLVARVIEREDDPLG